MRKLIIGVIALVILLLGLLIIAPGLVPSDVYKSRIEAELSKGLGRQVSIEGDVKLQSLPFIRAKTSDIKIANSDQFTDENLLSVETLEARIRLWPLFSKRVEISGFDLIKPLIFLEKNKNGDVNWDFAGDSQPAKTETSSDSFKRNGQFAELETQIEAFNLTDGKIVYRDQTRNETYTLETISGDLSLKNIASPLMANLSFSYAGKDFDTRLTLDSPRQFLDGKVTPFDGRLTSGFGQVSLQGEFIASEQADLSAKLDADITDLQTVKTFLPTEIPYIDLVSDISLNTVIDVTNGEPRLSNINASAKNGIINGEYRGELTLAEIPEIDGTFTVEIAQLSDLNAFLDAPLPYSEAVEKFAATSAIRTQGDIYTLSGLKTEFSDGLINGGFSGDAQFNSSQSDPLSIEGKLDANITNIRALAAINGTELPPNTAAGSIFETASLDGALKGSLSAMKLNGVTVKFDDIEGEGEVDIALTSEIPFVTANMTLAGLDLRPYMASYSTQKPEGKIEPWNEAPINVAAFQAIEGVFNLSTPYVITDRIRLEETRFDATLRDGLLKANLPEISLYGGTGNLNIAFDTSAAKPELTFSTSLDSLEGNPFLAAIAGITQATGEAETSLTVSSTGLSQAEIMRNLNGEGGFKLLQGQIKGIDTNQFLSGLEQALTARQLPQGIGTNYATTFENIAALFKIENGVVTINDFDLSAKNVAASGGGKIDLGNQKIDFSFRPRTLNGNENTLTNFGIPLQFSGSFGEASAGLDTDFLTQILTAKAKQKATSALKDRVGGSVGSLLGDVINGTSQTGTSQNGNEADGQTGSTPTSEEVITNTLGGLLGLKTPEDKTKQETESDKDETEEKAEEKSELEKALGSIFDK